MYTTYEFYTTSYHGSMVSADDFDKYEQMAEDKLNYLTMDRIDADMLAAYENRIGKATCALMEFLYQIDVANTNALKGEGAVQSRSSGGESITYAARESIVTSVLTNQQAQDSVAFNTIRTYLSGTGLLYQGV